MSTIRTILVPIDFGESSDEALQLALSVAEKFAANVVLIHAVSLPTADAGYGFPIAWPLDDLQREADAAMQAQLTKSKPGSANIEGSCIIGDAWDVILTSAKRVGADLIVMGTHGRRGIQRFLMGSVAEKVVRLSPVPVLTVSARADQAKKPVTTEAAPGHPS